VTTAPSLTLTLLPGRLAVCRLEEDAPLPVWAVGSVTSITRTPDELSVVCSEETVPDGIRAERGFRCLAVAGPLDFALTGVLASLAPPLAAAGVSIFVVSTFDTDLLLVRDALLARAVTALGDSGHRVIGFP
jgi:uncharacterized protein